MLCGEVGADGDVAGRIEQREELPLFKVEVPVNFRLDARGDIAQERCVCIAVGRSTSLAGEQRFEPLHHRHGGAVLLMELLADPVGEHHA